MKKNYFLRAAGALLLAGVLMLGGVSGTVARFSESADAGQYARVAAFRVLVDGKVLGAGDDIEVNLFTTLYSHVDDVEADDEFDELQKNDSEQELSKNVPVDTPIIAPGNGGEFAVAVENLSEVPIAYFIGIDGTTLQNADGIPVQFRVKDSDGDWEDWVSTFSTDLSSSGTLGPGLGTAKEVLVQWRWVYELSTDINGRDAIDTELGIDGQAFFSGEGPAKTLSVGIKATAYQLD